ncbi:hypothetical protein FS842_006085 [Serendipita sp. 407]|nr:hypothetical protein FS842_006085 [Serendipita sp. 407]
MASDIYSRLHSIKEDIQFVLTVAKQYPHYPLFANQRCGAWYADPTRARVCLLQVNGRSLWNMGF